VLFQNLLITTGVAAALFTTGATSLGIDDLSFRNLTVRFTNASGRFGNFGSNAAGNNDSLVIMGIFGYRPSGGSSAETFLTVDTDWVNPYVANIHAPDWATLYSGPLTDADSIHYHSIIRDGDNDTLIQVEESADEDIIRFDTGGTERMTITNARMALRAAFFNMGAATELTISAGSVTAVRSLHSIDTEGDAGTDDLDEIAEGQPGDWLFIAPASGARTVVLRHGVGGLDSIYTKDGQDLVLAEATDLVLLFRTGIGWHEIGRNVGAGIEIERLFVVAKSGAYTVTASDGVVIADASGGAFTITLPTAVGITGRVYRVKKIDATANAVTIDANGAETIDGGITATIATQYEAITIVSDNAEWWVL
jgi:hypothetical protein